MVELLDPRPGQLLLELAAGPGETGFRALPFLQPGGELLSTDVAPEMVEVARRRAAELGLTAVLCRFGLMLVPEMGRAAAEISRVLRPGGRAVLAVWASSRLNPWMTAGGKAALELGLTEPPDREAPGPFRLSEPGRLRAVVEATGLTVERVEDVPVAWAASSLDEWWETSKDTSRMLTMLLARLTGEEAGALRARAERYLQEYVADDGTIAVPGLARVLVAAPP